MKNEWSEGRKKEYLNTRIKKKVGKKELRKKMKEGWTDKRSEGMKEHVKKSLK